MMWTQRPSPYWMKSMLMSGSHHRAREEVENHREHEARDHSAPQGIQGIFHRFTLRINWNSMPADSSTHPYSSLTPDVVLNAIEAQGLRCDGRLLALNSYENRVYQVGIEEAAGGGRPAVVAKFYRPERWTDQQILEEHAFSRELASAEIPVVDPMAFAGKTLLHHGGFRLAVFPRRGGRAPELEDPETLEWLGRFIGRIHAIGGTKPFAHRPRLDIESFGEEPRAFLLASGVIPPDLVPAWKQAAELALEAV